MRSPNMLCLWKDTYIYIYQTFKHCLDTDCIPKMRTCLACLAWWLMSRCLVHPWKLIWRFPKIGYPQIIYCNCIFHYKLSILECPHCRKPPFDAYKGRAKHASWVVLSDLPNQISPELSLLRGLESLSVAKGTHSTCAERLGSSTVGGPKNSFERSYEIYARTRGKGKGWSKEHGDRISFEFSPGGSFAWPERCAWNCSQMRGTSRMWETRNSFRAVSSWSLESKRRRPQNEIEW